MRKKVKRMKAAMCVVILEQSNCVIRICVQDQRCYCVALIGKLKHKENLARKKGKILVHKPHQNKIELTLAGI